MSRVIDNNSSLPLERPLIEATGIYIRRFFTFVLVAIGSLSILVLILQSYYPSINLSSIIASELLPISQQSPKNIASVSTTITYLLRFMVGLALSVIALRSNLFSTMTDEIRDSMGLFLVSLLTRLIGVMTMMTKLITFISRFITSISRFITSAGKSFKD